MRLGIRMPRVACRTPIGFLEWNLRSKGSTCRRVLHMTSQRASGNSQQVPATWLRRVLEDDHKPPKLYAWTPDSISSGAARLKKTAGANSGDDERRRIHILGIGNMGRLYATCLAKLANRPPIALVVHRKELLEHWVSQPGIEFTRHGKVGKNTDFDIEWWTDEQPTQGPVTEPASGRGISNLVVATKASDAIPQVDRLRGYLDSNSTVAFTQNGMCKLWPPFGEQYVRARFPGATSPSWIACVTTHGVISLGPFRSIHASPADAWVGSVMMPKPKPENNTAGEGPSYLIEQIANAPDLAARRVSMKELWVAQLEKLVVNAVINPLTAVLDCKNGELFVERGDGLSEVIDRLLDEASRTLRALVRDPANDEIFAEPATKDRDGYALEHVARRLAQAHEELDRRFALPRLREMLLGVAAKVTENTSSMLQDVRAGKQTEINDFNGWLVETARYLDGDIRLPTHERLIALVKARTTLTREEICERLLA